MNKNLIYGLTGGVAVLILVLILIKNNINVNKNSVLAPEIPVTPTATGTGTILLTETLSEKTDNGFSPQEITLKKGAAVKFVNKSSSPMWIASGPHPTHTGYPEFDQKMNGDTYSFIFDKVGSWKYHNHSPFSSDGVVIVTE